MLLAERQSSAADGLQERNTQNQPEGPPVRCSSLFGLLGPRFDSRPLFSLLVLLLPLPLDVELPLLAPEFRRAFPLELVPVNRQFVVYGDLTVHDLPHGGERQRTVLQLEVLELFLFLVRPAHRPGELAPVLLDRQGGRPLHVADRVLALPRPDRVRLPALRDRKAADPEY